MKRKKTLGFATDFKTSFDTWFEHGNEMALFGKGQGTYAVQGQLLPENHWSLPAAWKATVREDKLAVWRVYCDTKPVFDIMARNAP